MVYICKNCGKEFEAKQRTFVCSECRVSGSTCKWCGKSIPYGRKTCSYSCNSKYNATYNNPMDDLENREKIRQTHEERYGEETRKRQAARKAEWEAGREQRQKEGIEKWKKSIKKNGKPLGMAVPEVKERIMAEAAKNGGMGLANPKIRKKAQKTVMKRYGVDNPAKDPEIRKIISEKLSKISITPEHIEKTKKTLMKKYGVTNAYHVGIEDRAHSYISKPEQEIADYLRGLGVSLKRNDHSVLGSQELDIYCPEQKIAIEFNGAYWHSDQMKTKMYHYNKSKRCKDKGIRLIHIYEWEWVDGIKRDIIKSYLSIMFNKVQDRIYARNCDIREVSTKDYREFCNNNHLQGYRHASIIYGLYHNDTLVQLMSFHPPQKRNAKDVFQWEIVRGCPGSNNIVIGGVSKLWKHFLKKNNPDSVMSYCDLNKFTGDSYELIGMSLHHIEKANQFLIDTRTNKVQQWIYRNREKREDQMKNSFRVFGVGNALYQWHKNENKISN